MDDEKKDRLIPYIFAAIIILTILFAALDIWEGVLTYVIF